MELEGSLKAFSLPEILQFLAMSKLTGTLTIKRPDAVIALTIRHGRIVNSSAFDRMSKIGQMLVYRGVIQRSDLQQVLDHQRESEPQRKVGELLIDKGMITQDTLKQTLKLQLEEEVWNLFDCEDGDFKFEHLDPDDIDDVVVEVDIEPLIIEGTRRLDEWSRITQNLDSDDMVVAVSDLPENWERDLTLTDHEWLVLSMVNGFYTIGSISRRSCLGKFETYRILNSFLSAGIIYVKSPEEISFAPGAAETDKDPSNNTGTEERKGRTKGLGQILSFKSGGSNSVNHDKSAQPVSTLGVLCQLVNKLIAESSRHRDFGTLEPNFLQSIWIECLNLYPRVDLIYARNNRIHPHKLERYFEINGLTAATRPCYEDGLEALELLLSRLYMQCSQRLGERQASRYLNDIQHELENIYSEHPSMNGFSIKEMLERIVPTPEGETSYAR